MKNLKNKRKMAVAVVAGLAITGIIGASAASLGGISDNDFGADAELVASCDTDGVTVDFDLAYAGGATVGLATVDITEIGNAAAFTSCDGLAYEVELWDASGTGASLGVASGTVPVAAGVLSLAPADFEIGGVPATAINAGLIDSIAITITG